MGQLLGYARVSTAEQNADLQTDELAAAGCYRVYVDHASGVLDPARSWRRSWARCGRGTAWWCGGWTASAARCGI